MPNPELTQAIAARLRARRTSASEILWGIFPNTMTVDELAADLTAAVEAHLRPVVTTVAELDALPHGSVIRVGGVHGYVLQRDGSGWYEPGHEVGETEPRLPATVLYRPEAK